MTKVIVPVAAEVLVNRPPTPPLMAYPSSDPWPDWGSWVGADPRLETPDADARYGQVTTYAATITRGVGLRLGPWAPAGFAPVEAWVDYQAYAPDPVLWGTRLGTTFSGTGSFTSNNAENDPVAGWRTGRLSLPFVSIPLLWTHFLAAVAASNVALYCLPTNPDGSLYTGAFKVSWLQLVLSDGGRTALQWNKRPDGLGLEGVTPWRSDNATNQWRPVT